MPYLTDEEINKRIAMESNRANGLAQIGQAREQEWPSWMPKPEIEKVEPERTLGGSLKDVGVSVGKGLVDLAQAGTGLVDLATPGNLGKGLENIGIDMAGWQEDLSDQYTPAQQKAFEEVENVKGFLPTLGKMIEYPSTIGHGIVESIPSMYGGGLIGRGALKALPGIAKGLGAYAGTAAGAAGESAITAGQVQENIRQQSGGETTLGQQAKAIGAGLGTGAFSVFGNFFGQKLAKKLGVDITDIDTAVATGKLNSSGNIVKRLIAGGISEGVFEELPQSMQEQVWTNAALGNDLTEGVGEAGAAGLLAGTAMGGGMNVFTSSAKDNFNQDELNRLDKEKQDIQKAESEAVTPEEQNEIQTRKEAFKEELISRKELVETNLGIVKSPEELQQDREQLQFEYEQLFGLPVGVKSATESAEAILAQRPLADIEQAQRDRQRQIDQTYLPAEAEVDRINQFRLEEATQAEQPEPVPLRASDMITRNGQPYQRREYLEGYLEALPNKEDYEIVETDGGFVGRLTDEALDPRRNQMVWEDETGQYPSEKAYWDTQREKIRQQQETPLQTVMERSVPFEERLPRENQRVIDELESEEALPTQPDVTPVVEQVEPTGEEVGRVEEPAIAPEEPTVEETPTTEPEQVIQDQNAIREDFRAREALIVDMESELEENKKEQSQLGVNDPMKEELQYRAEELQGQIQEGNRELLVDRLSAGPDAQFETRSDTEPGQGIALPGIQKMYKGQDVFQSEDGTISVRFKNGKGATIQNIQDAGNGFVQMAIDTGQMSKAGKILGVTTGNNILLDSEFADNATLWHENKHVLDNLGMITERDNSLLNKEFNKLRKADKLNFGLSTHEDPRLAMEENRANMFAQIMVEREAYRDTALGKLIQKIMDFFNKLYGMGIRFVGLDTQTVSEFANEIESGKIYERSSVELKEALEAPQFRGAGNVNSEEFKNWFENSVAKRNTGEPVPFYHGSPNEFTVFEDRAGTSTQKTAAGLGHFFTMDKDYAAGYAKGEGNVIEAYLKMEKPYKMSLDESDRFVTIQQATERKDTLKAQGYDSIILQIPGAQPIITVFEPNQVKSTLNHGTFDSENPDIRFEARELKDANWDKKYPKINFEVRERLGIPEQTISEADYVKNRKQHKDLIGRTKQALKSTGRSLNRTLNKYLGVTSTNLLKIHPMLQAKTRKLDFDTIKRIQSNIAIATPVLEKMNKMSKNDQTDFDWAVKNGDFGKIMSLAKTYDFIPQYQALQNMLDKIHQDLKDVGYRPGYVENYWPRVNKDYEGYLLATKEISQEPIFTKALEHQAKKLGTEVSELSPDMRANIISQKIAEVKAGIGGPGNIHQRVYEKIPLDLGKYYAGASASLVNYIYSTAKNIEGRKFFGKVPLKIKNARQIIFNKTNEIKTLEARKAELVAANQDTTEIDEQIASKQDYIEDHQKKLEEYGQAGEFKDDIGSYVDELMAAKLIKPEDEKTLKDILEARFYEHGTTGKANVFKNLSLIDTMGSPLSAITQIQDLGFSVYVGGLTPRGITNSVKNIGKALMKRSDIKKEDLGLEWIAQEFADPDTLSRAVNKIFKLTKLDRMDTIGKEVLVNNSYDNYRIKAENKAKLFKEIRHMFSSDKETNQVIEDLRNDVKDSHNVQFLVFSRLLDFQPATKSEMAEKALTAGNWRLAYLLKSFTIKQLDVFRRDVWHKLKEGAKTNDKAMIAEGMKNMGMLLGLLSVAGAGADELKDLILGKDIDFEDHFIEQLASLGGANRYLRMQVRKEGVGTALGKQILPPFKFIDAITKDTAQNTWDLDSARWVDSVPLAGKIYSWRMGRASQYRSSQEEKDFKKDSKEFRKFNKEFEESDNKRLFIKSNLEMFKQKKLYDNFNKALRGNKSTITKLKNIEQTTNVRKRLSQLEQQRKTLISKYFEMKNNLG